MIIKKDFKIVKAKVERKSLALKAKKESSDEECSTSESEDEEYTMAVRDFKKFFKRRYKKQREFIGGSWSDSGEEDDEKVNNETCLVAQASSETDDEPTEKELKQIKADDQAIQTILLCLPEDIYVAVDSCETAQEIWLRVQQMMKGSDIRIQEKKAMLFNEWERFTSTDGESIESYYHQWSRHVTIVHQTKDLYTTDYTQLYNFLKYNQKEVDDLKAERLARTQDPLALMATSNNPYTFPVLHQDQPSFNQNYMQQLIPNLKDITDPSTAMNMALALMNVGNLNNVQNVRNQVFQNAVQNPRIQNVGNQNGLIVVLRNANQNPNGNGNLVAARAEGNATGHNADLDEIKKVNAHYILMANLQQASISGTQTNKAPVYDSDGSAEVHNCDNCYDNEIFNMFTQEEQYTELLEPIPEPHQVLQNDNNVISKVSSVEQSGGLVEQHFENVEETRVLYYSLYNNLTIEVKKVNTVNRKLRETNAELTTELARFTNQKKCFEISQEKYDKLERCYQQSVYQEQCLTKKINAIHLNSDTHNWSSSAHQKLHKIIKDEIIPIVNQVDARVQTFEIQFLKEAAKFVGDFKSLAKEADESLAKHKALELEIDRLLRAVVGQDIMFVVQNNSVVVTSNLQTELERTKEHFENCIIKKENEYAKLLNDWYKKCKECKFDKISYDNAYNDMQQKIKRLQAQLGDLKGKSKDTSCVSDQKDITSGTSVNTKFAKQSILGKPPKVGESHALSKPVTSNLIPTPQESKVMKNDMVIAPGMFRINPFKPSKEEKYVPNKVRASVKTNPITVLQPPVITKKVVNSDSNGLSSTGVDNTKTRRLQPRSNTKNDRVPSVSSYSKNKEVEVEEHHRKLLLSRNKKHMSSECNNVKLATQNVKSKVVCAMCKQCLITVNHDVCLLNYVNDMNSRGKKQKVNVSINENQKKQNPKVKKTKKVRNEHIATIMGFSVLQWGNILITSMYFVEGLGHNLFSVGRFCDSDLEVSFRRNACFVKNLEGVDLLSGNRTTNLYTINLHEMASASLICFIAHASSTKSWLWHQCLSHLNFDTINDLAKNDLVTGLPKFKYHKEHLCPSCEQGKSKRASHPPKPVLNSRQRNQTLVEAARTMLIFSRSPLYLWAEAIATACFTQNRSIIHRRFNKTPYELINGTKLDISFLHVFGALCYPKNDREDIGKLGAKGDIGFFIGYSTESCAYRVYNRKEKKIIETMNVTFDELSAMAFEQSSSKPGLQSMTFGQISSGLDLTYAPSTITTQQPTEGELDLLFEATYDDYIGGQLSTAPRTVLTAQAHQDVDGLASQQQHAQQQGNQAPLQHETVTDNVPNAMFDEKSFVNPFANPSTSAAKSSSSQHVDPSNMHTMEATRIFLAYAAHKSFTVLKMDVKNAFLHDTLKEDVYVCQPKGFIDADHPIHVFTLKKALYGLKRFDDDILVVQVYVDDIIFGSTHPRYTQLFYNLMKSRFEMSMMGEMTFFLGLQVNQSPCGIFINQSIYVLEILKKYGMKSCDPVGTPMEIKDKLDLDQNGTPAKPTEKHLKEVKRIFRYLRGTINTCLWYTKDTGFKLTGFSDADYAGCKYTFKSTSGGAQFLGEKLVSWSSKKHDCTSLSTAEVEYVSLSACCAQVLWIRTQLTDYGFHYNKIPIYCDSKSAIAISCNPVQHSRTKHITVRYHFIKEHVKKGMIELYFVKTDYQLANIFTKALTVDRFNYLVRLLGMRSLSPQELDRLAKLQ
uniref:Retrovirus-related Pol polyprotein from transposon TNT 1-94 n=1 Tax=Tanacetum cinerariifolium TaxID=118510 RepID=A0A6L2MYM6_TANCI|nr:retrovirus-related Pol polyprotein from transposon TNT 1-94 [Tanacetum cinerariifolium]